MVLVAAFCTPTRANVMGSVPESSADPLGVSSAVCCGRTLMCPAPPMVCKAGSVRPPVSHRDAPRPASVRLARQWLGAGVSLVRDLTEEEARAALPQKWGTVEPGVIPAYVAEMDFAPAPVVADAVIDAVRRGVTGYPGPGDGGVGAA